MPTKEAIIKAVGALQALGVQGGPDRRDPGAIRIVAEVWSRVLAPLSDGQLEACVVAWVAQPGDVGRWWPTPGGLLALEPSRRLAAVDDSGEAWGRVLRLAERGQLFPRYGGPQAVLTPAEQAGVDACGGRDAVASSGYDEHGWMQSSFRRAYQGARQIGAVLAEHPQLSASESRDFLAVVDRGGAA
jgi:hypothetical protein